MAIFLFSTEFFKSVKNEKKKIGQKSTDVVAGIPFSMPKSKMFSIKND